VTFGLSALIVLTGVRSRPEPGRPGTARASLWSVSAHGVRIVFGSRLLLTLLLFGWLAGFYIVPEGLAAPYARFLHGNALTVGLLMAAVPLGMVIGAFLISRIAAPSARIMMMGWLAVLSCAPLIGSAWSPPLWVVLTLAGAGRAYQLAAAAAFVQALRPDTRARAFGVAQSGLYAVQGRGILAGGAVAQLIGAPLTVGLAGLVGLVGLTAATMLAMRWTHLRGRLIQARPNGPESPGPGG
jgi:MFS family permease